MSRLTLPKNENPRTPPPEDEPLSICHGKVLDLDLMDKNYYDDVETEKPRKTTATRGKGRKEDSARRER